MTNPLLAPWDGPFGLPRFDLIEAAHFRPAFDVALARGFGGAAATWRIAEDLLLPGGRLVYWAGKSFDPDTDIPAGVRFNLLDEPGLESRGPIVIMARQ